MNAPTATAPRTLLHLALLTDAVVTGLNGLAYLALAGPLQDLLGLPTGPMRAAGAFLLVFTAAVAFLGTRPRPPRGAVLAVVALNVAWVVGSLAVDAETVLGQVWVVAQAVVVAAFAAVQAYALRRR
ncbi:hypothetical protein [Pseudonocardia sp.]|uniref:hypothetical protein n=1 Tax=Pseudonocardia sp. TaxID=60912 RepID=UPI003D0F6170